MSITKKKWGDGVYNLISWFDIEKVEKVIETYMSPGAVTEIIHLYIGEYTDEMKVTNGGGLAEEHEEIEVLEIPIQTALKWIVTGEIKDAKTIILLQYLAIELKISPS